MQSFWAIDAHKFRLKKSVPGAVQLALRTTRIEFVVAALIGSKTQEREHAVWGGCIAYLRVLEDHHALGDWRIANLIFWLSFEEIGEQQNPILTIKDICILTGHSERSARRHLDRLIAGGFIARRHRSRISTWPGDEYSIPHPVLMEARDAYAEIFKDSPIR
jgi:hypothetical protein